MTIVRVNVRVVRVVSVRAICVRMAEVGAVMKADVYFEVGGGWRGEEFIGP